MQVEGLLTQPSQLFEAEMCGSMNCGRGQQSWLILGPLKRRVSFLLCHVCKSDQGKSENLHNAYCELGTVTITYIFYIFILRIAI